MVLPKIPICPKQLNELTNRKSFYIHELEYVISQLQNIGHLFLIDIVAFKLLLEENINKKLNGTCICSFRIDIVKDVL
jgi:hypothetical protein